MTEPNDDHPITALLRAMNQIEGAIDAVNTAIARSEQLEARNTVLQQRLQECVKVMERHIYPKPDVPDDHPYAVLKRAREEISAEDSSGGDCRKCGGKMSTYTVTVCPRCDVKTGPSRPVLEPTEAEKSADWLAHYFCTHDVDDFCHVHLSRLRKAIPDDDTPQRRDALEAVQEIRDYLCTPRAQMRPEEWTRFMLLIDLVRRALSESAVPEGWKLVPVEPNDAMLFAGSFQPSVRARWDAMLAAAPEPDGEKEGETNV